MRELRRCTEQQKKTGFFVIHFSKLLQKNELPRRKRRGIKPLSASGGLKKYRKNTYFLERKAIIFNKLAWRPNSILLSFFSSDVEMRC